MMSNKSAVSMLSLLIAFSAVALLGMLPVHQAWLINAWSVQYTHHVLISSTTKQSTLAAPPAGHARAVLWLAFAALQSRNPALAETLVTSQAAQGNKLAMHLMVDVRLAQGDFAGALAIWQQVGDVASLLQAALQAQQAGHPKNALMAYEAAWTLDPESSTLPLANFLLDYRQDYSTAEKVLRQSLATLPNSRSWPLWSNLLGDALRAQNRWDEAATAYENTIVQAPDDWAAHIGLGWTRYERGDGSQAAMDEFQKAINAPKSQGSGQLAIARMLIREDRLEEADTWFVDALALNPEGRWWYVERGNAALRTGNLTLALAVYQETLVRFPDFAPAYYELAYAYQLNKQSAQAIAAIEQALALMMPPNAYYYSRAGSIYEWAGDADQALHAYRQALMIDPQNTAALKGVEKLGP
jgi:tetratricopeptide (TPR) repeat protein